MSASSGELFDQSQMKKYRLKVTAGTEYDPTTHQSVPVNGDQTVMIDNELATVSLSVRLQDYNGISSPSFIYGMHNSCYNGMVLTG